jgi:transcriptional regulator with XRE-family HTH domain
MRGMTDHLTIGQRVAWYRQRRGYSQEALANLVGRTADWLSKVENGRAELDRLSVIRLLADRLDVSLGDLIGEPTVMDWTPDTGTRTVPALRAALMDYRQITPLAGTPADGEPPDLDTLREQVAQIWSAYQASKFGYVTHRLPQVLAAAQTADRAYAGSPAGRLAARTHLPGRGDPVDQARRGRPGLDRRRPGHRHRAARRRTGRHRITVPIGQPRPGLHRPLRRRDRPDR